MVKILSNKTRNIIFAVGIGLIVLAVGIPMLIRAVQEHALASSYTEAQGKLVIEAADTYNAGIVTYLEEERTNEACAAKSVGHDDMWVYALIICSQFHEEEQYTSSYELQGRLAYSTATNKILSGEFLGEDGTNPSPKDLYPYKIYQAIQKELRDNALETLTNAARSRASSR